jgi:hypothetical protein
MHGLAGPLLIEISSKVIDGHLTSWPESDGNGFLFSSLSIKPLEITKNAISYITNARLPNSPLGMGLVSPQESLGMNRLTHFT